MITVIAVLLGVALKIRNDIVYRTVRTIGKGKLMEILLLVNQLTQDFAIDDLNKMLKEFIEKQELEHGMKRAAIDIRQLIMARTVLQEPSVKAVIQRYEAKKNMAFIKNKKRWEQLKNDPKIDKALDSILDILERRLSLQAMTAREKGKVERVENIIQAIKSDENILKNRETRKQIETATEKIRAQEKDEKLKKKGEDLHALFKKKK